jgi:hypothetical protein
MTTKRPPKTPRAAKAGRDAAAAPAPSLSKFVDLFGVPMDLGGARRGTDMGPSALRIAGLEEKLEQLAQRLIDEGLRMADHPGVIFKDGPTGRRAALASGPDVWEVIKFLREIDERGPAALDAAADALALDQGRVSAAVSYYADFPEEIDAEIAEADEASERAERAWQLQRRLIS